MILFYTVWIFMKRETWRWNIQTIFKIFYWLSGCRTLMHICKWFVILLNIVLLLTLRCIVKTSFTLSLNLTIRLKSFPIIIFLKVWVLYLIVVLLLILRLILVSINQICVTVSSILIIIIVLSICYKWLIVWLIYRILA